jgi:hypothetical protein
MNVGSIFFNKFVEEEATEGDEGSVDAFEFVTFEGMNGGIEEHESAEGEGNDFNIFEELFIVH